MPNTNEDETTLWVLRYLKNKLKKLALKDSLEQKRNVSIKNLTNEAIENYLKEREADGK